MYFEKLSINVAKEKLYLKFNNKNQVFLYHLKLKGTGLGLSMSYDIITKSHNGELKVDSKENKGSIFTI